MKFTNSCGCIVDYKILEASIIEECERRGIPSKDHYRIYMYRGYAGISLKHDKVSVHRIIGKYIVGFDFDESISVHHIDGNRMNNDISNLQVVKKSLHTKMHYLVQYVSKDTLIKNAQKATDKRKRKDIKVDDVFMMKNQGFSVPQIAQLLNCGENTVYRRLQIRGGDSA